MYRSQSKHRSLLAYLQHVYHCTSTVPRCQPTHITAAVHQPQLQPPARPPSSVKLSLHLPAMLSEQLAILEFRIPECRKSGGMRQTGIDVAGSLLRLVS